MNILVVAATELEIDPYLKFLKSKPYSVDVLISGVGMVSTAFELGKKLAENRYGAMLNVGIAGSFDKEIELGSIVRVQSDSLSELGAQNNHEFLTIEKIGFGKSIYYENATPFLKYSTVSKLKVANGITVNTVHGNKEGIENIIKRLNPDTESMEGAAFFYAAQKSEIYALQVRSISNIVEVRNRSNWEIDLAIQNINNWLMEFTTEFYS